MSSLHRDIFCSLQNDGFASGDARHAKPARYFPISPSLRHVPPSCGGVFAGSVFCPARVIRLRLSWHRKQIHRFVLLRLT
jgi:hypothetical protein